MNLRLVILDYPKLMLAQDRVRRIFGDMVIAKQQNFARTSESYVSMGPLDMISTHFLIYNQNELYHPKIIGAFRCCWGNRTQYHKLRLPIEDYITYAPIEYRKEFEKFRVPRPIVVDANAWFVDPDYTFSKTGLKLSEMLYYALVQFIVRKGFDHWVGATNERYKASRWALPTGTTRDGMIFTHPQVQDPHKLLLFETLNYDWLYDCSKIYFDLMDNRFEFTPSKYPMHEALLTVGEVLKVIESRRTRLATAA